MKPKTVRTTVIASAIGLAGLVGGSTGMIGGAERASAATKTTTYPTACSRMLCSFPMPTVWNQKVSYEGVTCTLPGVTCPTVVGGRAAYKGQFVPGLQVSGIASAAATVEHQWITTAPPPSNPNISGSQFIYDGAAGSAPDSVTFTIDRAAVNQSLLDLGGSATMSVFLDDLDSGTTLTLVNQRPIANSPDLTTDPTVSVDPGQLTIGHKYSARVVTRISVTGGALPNVSVYYLNFALTASAEDTDDDDVADNEDGCPAISDPDQIDTDGDGSGDACDTTPTGDEDGDGVDNGDDNCREASNPGQTDLDRDGSGDACDTTPTGDTVLNSTDPNPRDGAIPPANPQGGTPGVGVVSKNRVFVTMRCPKRAQRNFCRAKAVGRFARRGPRVTSTARVRIRRGRKKVVALRVKPRFLDAANRRGKVTVLRYVRSKKTGRKQGTKRFVLRPIVN